MARIVLADDGIEFDGNSPSQGPLGGVESSVVNLCRELAARGHSVHVRNMCREAQEIDGVDWAPLSQGLPGSADLYIANRGDKLIKMMPEAKRTVFWIHNPARYLLKWRYLSKLWQVKPAIIFIGEYHATTYPGWAPGGDRIVIPYGIETVFREVAPFDETPPRRAIFTSNPLRSLDWLLDIWARDIRPQAPDAELHIFSGAATYGKVGDGKATPMELVLEKARSLANEGVVVRDPVSKQQLTEEFKKVRVMLYKGDENETFCLAVGEAQAAGVPAVVQQLGSVVERVIHGATGAITESDQQFAAAAVALLTDDALWRQQHEAAQAQQRSWTWASAAEAFEKLIPS
ncbi:MAG: glycosyltransferase family 4 protein [Rhodospirillaceae bacterium]